MVDALIIINGALVFLYGFFLNISFAGGCRTERERHIVGNLCVGLLALQVLCYFVFGFTFTRQLYPLISHLPLILVLVFILKKPLGVSVVSLLIAYFCCQLPRWVASLFYALFGTDLAYHISYSIVIFPIFYA